MIDSIILGLLLNSVVEAKTFISRFELKMRNFKAFNLIFFLVDD